MFGFLLARCRVTVYIYCQAGQLNLTMLLFRQVVITQIGDAN
jgi:hypothetical protein